MLLLIFEVDHFVTLLAFANVTAAVGFVKVDSVARELFVAI